MTDAMMRYLQKCQTIAMQCVQVKIEHEGKNGRGIRVHRRGGAGKVRGGRRVSLSPV